MPDFDLPSAHKYFSAACFNACWELIDKPSRTPEEDEQMLLLTLASHYHWTQRPDYTPTKASVAFWQIARVYALLGQTANAIHYGDLCLQASSQTSVEPFYRAYAHEALARAYGLAGEAVQKDAHLAAAYALAEQVSDLDERAPLIADLKTI